MNLTTDNNYLIHVLANLIAPVMCTMSINTNRKDTNGGTMMRTGMKEMRGRERGRKREGEGGR